MADVTMDVPSTAQVAANVETARVPYDPATFTAGDPEPAQETRAVWVNGELHVVAVGKGVVVPAEVAEVLQMQMTPNLTAQSQGAAESTPPGDPAEVEEAAPAPAAASRRTQTTTSTAAKS